MLQNNPVSLPSWNETNSPSTRPQNKRRVFTISALAVLIAVVISLVAKVLVHLIDFITNISFYGSFSIEPASPAGNSLGLWVIVVPVVGGLLVGIMAVYGSKAIRGHGIPEAMEQILTNQSKIRPTITYLKPVSAAISIGTGGPFGAEGPIIATGGALGSTLGQLLKITHNERKILLAAGATAGMAAIFGSPAAAIFLAIELLLFEFSPRSVIPVALACITGAAGHHLLFGVREVFPMEKLIYPASNSALGFYSLIGIVIGVLSVAITKIVYFVEDSFEKLPVHWALWPALGGIVVGIVGYYAPRTLGVGYSNITAVLTGTMPLKVLLSLCILKFISWAVSLGSGTSGGTLAPLLTMGAAAGALLGGVVTDFFPFAGVNVPLAALVGMAAMFAGASRAFLTSIVFALETTGQSNALLPLLAACTGAYFVSYFSMENTIMTEKIARRGIKVPDSYEPDALEKLTVGHVLNDQGMVISEDNSIEEVRLWLNKEQDYISNYFIIATNEGQYKGILSSSNLFSQHHSHEKPIGSLVKRQSIHVDISDSLRTAVETMAKENIDVLPVISNENKKIIGIVSYHDILASYKQGIDEHEKKAPDISLKKQSLKILMRGQKLVTAITRIGRSE
ncbi:MAG: chloride channel protein [Bacteroidetes bacterium]|nr:chloride channel protein [Bacteroidota bacterium]